METTISRQSRNLGYAWNMGRNAPTAPTASGGVATLSRERDRHNHLKGSCDTTARVFVGGRLVVAFDSYGDWSPLDNLSISTLLTHLIDGEQVRVRLAE